MTKLKAIMTKIKGFSRGGNVPATRELLDVRNYVQE